MKTSELGIQLIEHYESLHDGDLSTIGLQPKADPVGIITVGYGHALCKLDGTWVKDMDEAAELFPQYMNIDQDTATELLMQDLESRENAINSLQLNLEQCEFDALVSFTYNVGFGNLKSSTLLKRIINNDTPDNIYNAFLMWNKAGGTPMRGLTYRRQSEANLYNTGEVIFYN